MHFVTYCDGNCTWRLMSLTHVLYVRMFVWPSSPFILLKAVRPVTRVMTKIQPFNRWSQQFYIFHVWKGGLVPKQVSQSLNEVLSLSCRTFQIHWTAPFPRKRMLSHPKRERSWRFQVYTGFYCLQEKHWICRVSHSFTFYGPLCSCFCGF